MLTILLVIVLILWLLGFTVFHLGGLLHVLLIIALVMFIWDMINRPRGRL